MNYRLLFGVLFASAVLAVKANPITRGQARLVAQELVGIDDMSADDVPVSPYYIFSRGAGKGFVIVSGDDSAAPIIGYTEQGDYIPEQLPEQLRGMLQHWGERLTQVQARRQAPADGKRKAKARAIATYKQGWTDVPALVKTHWHQSHPYNLLAPVKSGQGTCMTGCVATAGSQVTYYFHKDNPNELAYATPTYGYGTPITVSLPKGTPIEWNLMKLSGTGTAKQDSAVAKLMYALGTSAWLTYGDGEGTSTSGHNYKMAEAMNGQFQLTSAHWEKSGSSQQQWETKIYNNLKTRRPLLYSGVHPSNGGHSVVLDGYQASTGLYHFNFGWGGQGDGWYTVDDATGMNGFNSYQDLICDITPKVQNLSGSIQTQQVFHKAPSTVQVQVENNGTLDYSGIYLYVNTRDKMPSSSSASDVKTVLVSGKSAQIDFNLIPTNAQKDSIYVFLCDKNKRVLDTCLVRVTPTVADLRLSRLAVDAGTESVMEGEYRFGTVNSTTATVSATLTNGEQGTYCQPTFRCFLDSLDRNTHEWTYVSEIIMSTTKFNEQQTKDVTFAFKNLSEGRLYRAYLDKPAVASTSSNIQFLTSDSIAYFTVRQSDLKVETEGRTATVTGRWNAVAFAQQATDATVCSYDISGLSELNEQPVAPNPNALFYAAEGQNAYSAYDNVVVGDVCQQLVIQNNAAFKAPKPFTAVRASFVLTDAEPKKWHGTLLPFAAEVPYGMQMKQASELTKSILDHQFTRTVDAMSFVTYLTDRDGQNTIVSEQVQVSTDDSASMFDGVLRASTLETTLEEGSLVLGEYLVSLYFVEPATDQTTVAPFQPVVVGASAVRLRTTSETLADGYYRTLAQTINTAYQTLAQYPQASGSVLDTFMAELKAAEDLFTYRSHAQDIDIKDQNIRLTAAIKDFQQGIIDGVNTPTSADTDTEVTYYNLSGQRIDRPERGLVIQKRGSTARKILIK